MFTLLYCSYLIFNLHSFIRAPSLLPLQKFKVISANCMTLHHANHIYNKLLCDLCCSRRTTTSTPSKDGRDLYDDGFKPLSARQAMLKLQNRLTTPGPAMLVANTLHPGTQVVDYMKC